MRRDGRGGQILPSTPGDLQMTQLIGDITRSTQDAQRQLSKMIGLTTKLSDIIRRGKGKGQRRSKTRNGTKNQTFGRL